MSRFLQHLRVGNKAPDGDRSRSRSRNRGASDSSSYGQPQGSYQWTPSGFHRYTGHLPPRVLSRIFHHVAPHTSDETYKSLEDSLGLTGEGCVLCETRDLAACMQVNRTWAGEAQKKLYKSVRLDAVHYCEREIYLSEKRRHKHKPEDQQFKRLQLLERTLRERQYLAAVVEFLKVPYMTREGFKADLARIVSHTQNLKYVDLPEGVFTDNPSCMTLKGELQARCPDLRFMKYKAGSETTFALHVHGNLWYNLEVLGIEELDVELDVLLYALATLANLRKLNMENMASLSDELFIPNQMLPALPAIRTLRLVNAPSVTARGLLGYLRRPDVAHTTVSLQLENTGVAPGDLYAILDATPVLTALVIRATVAHALPATNIPPLASRTLRTFHFEILPETTHTLGNVAADSYYNYLANSLTSASMPSLRSLYAYYPPLPDLLIAPPAAPFGGEPARPMSSGGPPRLQAPASPGLPPRLSAQPGSLFPPQSPGLPPSMANRMSTLSLSPPSAPGSHGHSRSMSHSNYLLSPEQQQQQQRPAQLQRPSSSMGYNPGPFSPSQAQFAQASAPMPAPPNLAASLGLTAPLRIFTKPSEAEEMEWLVTVIEPPRPGGPRGGIRAARPVSLLPLEAKASSSSTGHAAHASALGGGDDLSWLADPAPQQAHQGSAGGALLGKGGGQLVGNGFGGYVEVKDEGKRGRRKGADWMG